MTYHKKSVFQLKYAPLTSQSFTDNNSQNGSTNQSFLIPHYLGPSPPTDHDLRAPSEWSVFPWQVYRLYSVRERDWINSLHDSHVFVERGVIVLRVWCYFGYGYDSAVFAWRTAGSKDHCRWIDARRKIDFIIPACRRSTAGYRPPLSMTGLEL